MKLARARYQVDLVDFVEFTTSETILRAAESDHTQALYNYKMKETELKYAVGRLKQLSSKSVICNLISISDSFSP